jgi:hypothetical protein
VSVVNQGNILADTSGRVIRIRGQSFRNEGLLGASNGGVLDVPILSTNAGQILCSTTNKPFLGGSSWPPSRIALEAAYGT